MATAKATSRSGDRAWPAADKGATKAGRWCRPNCRSSLRPNRRYGSWQPHALVLRHWAESSARYSSGQRITGQRVERTAAVLVLVAESTVGVLMASLNVGVFGRG